MNERLPETSEWVRVEQSAAFHRLLAAKKRFILPACLFFSVYYFALPLLVGWAPGLMRTRVFGPVNLAYVFALSQFFMAWIIAILYVRAASRFDRMVKDILDGKQ